MKYKARIIPIETQVVAIIPVTKPSHVFLGLNFGAILCLPNITPLKYAQKSLIVGITINTTNTNHDFVIIR